MMVFKFVLRCFLPFDPRRPLDNEISLHTNIKHVKGTLGQGGGEVKQHKKGERHKFQLFNDKCHVY